ncbi:MAG: M48 family metallopeptidase [Chitinispirillaceae bacterium]|jgi:predicted Zn-dependent protease
MKPSCRAVVAAVLIGSCCGSLLLLPGCTSFAKIATAAGQSAGVINAQQASSINRSAVAISKTFEDITPEQEYYIGRSVAATVLCTYKPFDRQACNHYLNEVGQTLALYSERPETFGGYHFLLIDSDEINAFAAPGGLVLVSRGMVRCCTSEDALAAVLAHEIGHVVKQHGLKAIKKGRLTSALTILAAEGAKNLGSDQLAQVTKDFEGSISDITSTMVNNGYSRTLEFEADREAVSILKRAGYDPNALIDLLQRMKTNLTPGSKAAGKGFAKTHPDPDDRIREVQRAVGNTQSVEVNPARQQRFAQAMANI